MLQIRGGWLHWLSVVRCNGTETRILRAEGCLIFCGLRHDGFGLASCDGFVCYELCQLCATDSKVQLVSVVRHETIMSVHYECGVWTDSETARAVSYFTLHVIFHHWQL
jgi:hypothetical protein